MPIGSRIAQEAQTVSFTCLPRRVSQCLRVLEPCFHHRHQLVFSWLLVLHLVYGERANLKALARQGPQHLAYQHYRRLLCAAYWCTKTLLWWFADQALQALPPPEDGILYLVGDSPLKGKRGPKPPVAHKTRLSQYHPYVFGFRIVLLMAQWDVYRIPVDFALLRRKDDPAYQPENALFRQMLSVFRRPTWCQEVVVTADAAYASRANLVTIQELGYWYVLALPRTWKFAQGKAVKDLVTHLPRGKYRQIRIPTVNTQRRRTFWVYARRVQLRHLGHVTVVLSKCRRNDGPKQTKILVTNMPETVTAREIVGVYLRRWWIELLMKELKGVVGMGQHQVTKHGDRVERSVAIAIMAYLLLLKLRAKDIPTDRPWSAFRLQRALAWEVIQEQSERSARQIARKWLQMGKAA
jgi:Transposase DDE domain